MTSPASRFTTHRFRSGRNRLGAGCLDAWVARCRTRVGLMRTVLAGLVLAMAGPALACPVCAPSATLTPAQQMINADRIYLASPQGADRAMRIEAVIKGPEQAGDTLEAIRARSDAVVAGKALLVMRDGLNREWSVLGEVDPGQLSVLRDMAHLKRTREMTRGDWDERVARFVPLLQHPDPLIAEAAYGEVARSPYSAMRAQRALLDRNRLARWVDDPTLRARRPLYVLLLGLAGGPADAEHLERQLVAPDRRNELGDLPALVAADLELRGPSRLPWIERHLLLDPKRVQAEVQAALVALSVHGQDNTAIPRERIVDTYLRFIAARPALSGLVAQDLASWGVWEPSVTYAALLERPDLTMASRVAIAQYLRSSPHPQARLALQKLAPRSP